MPRKLNRFLRTSLLCLIALFTTSCGPGFVASGDVTSAATPAPVSTTTGGSTTGTANAACGTDAWSNYAQTFFQSKCVSCHSNEATYSGVNADLSNIQSNITSNAMPLGATLAAADKARILAWIGCGAPQDPNSGGSGASGTTSSGTTGSGSTGTSSTTGGSGTGSASGGSTSTTTGSASGPSTCTADTYSNFAQGLFTTECVSCHSNMSTYAGIQSQSAAIQSQVSQNMMPLAPAPPLSDSDKQRLLTWFSCGLPQ